MNEEQKSDDFVEEIRKMLYPPEAHELLINQSFERLELKANVDCLISVVKDLMIRVEKLENRDQT